MSAAALPPLRVLHRLVSPTNSGCEDEDPLRDTADSVGEWPGRSHARSRWVWFGTGTPQRAPWAGHALLKYYFWEIK